MEEFNLCQGMGWSFQACMATPGIVRQIFTLYLGMQAKAREKQ